MNICVFSTHFGGGYGTGYSIKKEVAEFNKMGHNIFVVHNEKNIAAYHERGIKYYYFNVSRHPLINIYLLKKEISSIINEIIESNKIDLFYIQSLEFGLFIKQVADDIPVVYFSRSTIKGAMRNKPSGYWLDDLRKKLIDPILINLEYRCLNNCDLIIVKSVIMKVELENYYGVEGKKIKIIPGGIDDIDFPKMNDKAKNEVKNQIGIPAGKKIIIYSGRVVPIKGIYFLIKALGEILKRRNDIVLIIAGKSMRSRYFKIISRLIKSCHLEQNIYFLGYVPQNLMYKYYNISDLVVFPSTYEPFGMVAIQAVILGKPLVITDAVGAKDCISGYPALKVIKPFSSNDLAEAIIKLLDYRQEKNLKFDLSALLWTNVASRLLAEFSKLLKYGNQ